VRKKLPLFRSPVKTGMAPPVPTPPVPALPGTTSSAAAPQAKHFYT